MGWLFLGAPWLFWCSTQLCCLITGEGMWWTSFSLSSFKTSCIRPWSICSSRGTTKQQNKLVTSISTLSNSGIVNGIGFWPLGKTDHRNQDISVSFIALREGHGHIDGYPFQRCPELVLALIPVSGAATGCTGVALPALLINIFSCLAPVLPLSDFIQGLADTHVTSWQHTM
jgi:hypothetical protein